MMMMMSETIFALLLNCSRAYIVVCVCVAARMLVRPQHIFVSGRQVDLDPDDGQDASGGMEEGNGLTDC